MKKIIQIEVIPDYAGDEVYAQSPAKIVGLSDEGKVYILEDGNTPKEREWNLIK